MNDEDRPSRYMLTMKCTNGLLYEQRARHSLLMSHLLFWKVCYKLFSMKIVSVLQYEQKTEHEWPGCRLSHLAQFLENTLEALSFRNVSTTEFKISVLAPILVARHWKWNKNIEADLPICKLGDAKLTSTMMGSTLIELKMAVDI